MLTKNGISTTRQTGQFAYEVYFLPQSRVDEYRGKPLERRIQWDYRDMNGKLYSGVVETIGQAKQAAQNQSGEPIA